MTFWHTFFACWGAVTIGFVAGLWWASREREPDDYEWSDYDGY